MMKKLLAAAIVAGFAGVAAAQVTVSGKIAEYVHRTDGQTTMYHEPTSNIAFAARERIGGVTASAVLETSLFGNTELLPGSQTRLGDRQRTVGLANQFGSVDFGRNVHSHFLAVTINDAFSTLYGSVAGDLHGVYLRGLRLSDAVYVNVNPVKNVSVQYETTQGQAQEVRVYGAAGSAGPINLRVARWDQGREQSTVVGLNAQPIKNTRVSYIYSKDEGARSDTAHSVGVSHNQGAFTYKATYGTSDTYDKVMAVGADYALSKRTEVGVAWRGLDPVMGQDRREIGVGMVHRF